MGACMPLWSSQSLKVYDFFRIYTDFSLLYGINCKIQNLKDSLGARPNSSGAKSRELGLGLEILAAFPFALAECGQSQWNAYPTCMSCDFFNTIKCEYCLCGFLITANGIWIQPMKWEHCYIYSFFIASNITVSSLIYIPIAHGSAARVSRPLSLFPLPPWEKVWPPDYLKD